jgi:hypothetical protein
VSLKNPNRLPHRPPALVLLDAVRTTFEECAFIGCAALSKLYLPATHPAAHCLPSCFIGHYALLIIWKELHMESLGRPVTVEDVFAIIDRMGQETRAGLVPPPAGFKPGTW